MRDYFVLKQPSARMSDKAYVAYHGKLSVRYALPSVKCVCRRGSVIPYYGGTSTALDAMKLPATALGREIVSPAEWTRMVESVASTASSEAARRVTPGMTLHPIEYRRTSTTPFAFAFPLERVTGWVVSGAVAEILLTAGAGFSLAQLSSTLDAHLLHVHVEAAYEGSSSTCEHCGALLLDADARRNLASSVRLANAPIQVALGFGLVISHELLEALREPFAHAVHPPALDRIESPMSSG
jgi:hypothetical protein